MYPVVEESGFGLNSLWPEKFLSLTVETSRGPLEIHSAHVPNGSSNKWEKVEVLESIYGKLALDAVRPRILCGDFNCPQTELATGEVVTWGQRLCPSGEVKIRRRIHRKPGIRWDAAERRVLVGLREFGLRDAYRSVHGYSGEAASWFLKNKDKVVGRRFDHIFVSPELEVVRCEYLAEARSLDLSDHSPIEADVEWS
jgi:exodeoxyribonuclease III